MENERKQTVLVTGGASGMGLLLGQCYAREGKNVALVDINEEELNRKAEEIRAAGGSVLPLPLDIRNYQAVEAAVKQTVDTFGSLDILINCAGGAEKRICHASGKFWEVPIEVYDFGIDVNLKGAIYFDHAAMGFMMAQETGGVIVHLGSITGQEGCDTNIAYAASKSALMNGMTKSIALAGDGKVRCVCVAPGPVLTRPGMAGMKTLCGRAADPQEIVDMIMYAASEKGAFWNGSTLLMDGGRNVMFNKR